jgi:hypothetical protein
MINLIDLLRFRATLLRGMDYKKSNKWSYEGSIRISDTFILNNYYIRDTIYKVLND